MKRYAAKLLFVWNPDPTSSKSKRPLYEERIVVFSARSPSAAIRRAEATGRRGQLEYDSGHRLRFRGIIQCMELGAGVDAEEVWWEFRRHSASQVRKLIAAREKLWVFSDR